MNVQMAWWHFRCAWVDIKKGIRELFGVPIRPSSIEGPTVK